MGRDKRRKGASRALRGDGPPRGHWLHSADEPPLVGEIRRALADPNPSQFLAFASMLMLVTDSRQRDPFGRHEPTPEAPSRDELVASFIDVPLPEISALLAAIAAFANDDVLAARIHRELATRPELKPSWLQRLDERETFRATCMSHVLNDGDNIILGTNVPGGREFTTVVYVDHNMGTLVKDAMVIPQPFDVVIARYRELTTDPDTRWEEIPLADARVRIEEAIALGARTYPPFETEEWPSSRSLVEWIIRALPTGGQAYADREWTERDRKDIAARFFASPHGQPFDNGECREMLDNLLWFGTDFAVGDPMRWSAVRVEMLLDDWVPRKIVAPVGDLMAVPSLLRAYVRFAHDEVGIRAELTDEVLAAVDHWEPVYQDTIRSPRLQGADAIVDAMGFGPPSDWEKASWGLERLARHVGGAEQLDTLDDAALADEEFRWDGIPEDVAEHVREILELADACCDEMFDAELRTACRRVLRRIAFTGPDVFRRKVKPEKSAAAIVWMVGKINYAFGGSYGTKGPQVKQLAAHFGMKGSPSEKAADLLGAGEFDSRTNDLALGSPEYLTSARRAQIIRARDRLRGGV